jgi:hypothetical protein
MTMARNAIRFGAISGPARLPAGHQVELRVALEGPWSSAARKRIEWSVIGDSGTLAIRENVGPLLRYATPQALVDGTLLRFRAQAIGIGQSSDFQSEVSTPVYRLPQAPVQLDVRVDSSKRWWAALDGGDEFFVGSDVRYGSRRGLANGSDPIGPFYAQQDWPDQGHFAAVIEPTSVCESQRNFCCVNSYDRAAFTYGFAQHATHTPNNNFVVLLRRLLQLPAAAQYFPELSVQQGRIHHRDLGQLEDDTSTAALQAWINPDSTKVDPAEVRFAALLMHFTRADPLVASVQVGYAIEQMRNYFARKRVDLDGHSDLVCAIVWDIAHQGRAGANGYANKVRPALTSADPRAALLDIGRSDYAQRIDTLDDALSRMTNSGALGALHYAAATGSWI